MLRKVAALGGLEPPTRSKVFSTDPRPVAQHARLSGHGEVMSSRPRIHPPVPDLPGQRGLVTRRQLYVAGWSKAAVAHRLQRDWRLIAPGVVIPHSGPVDAEQRIIAGQLWAGSSAVLTGVHALAALGVERLPGATPLFLVPQTCRPRSTRIARTVRTTRPGAVALRRGLVRVATAERAVADAARYGQVTQEAATALTIAVLQRGLTVPVRVEQELWSSRANRVRALRRGLAEYCGGAWSLPEAALGRLVESSRVLPAMLRNHRVSTPSGQVLGIPDGYFPDAGLAVQVHSRQFHDGRDEDGRDRWVATVEKDSGLVSGGVIVIGVTPTSLAHRPRAFLRRLEQAYLAHRNRPLPDLRVEPA